MLALCIGGLCLVSLGLAALFAARNWREALRWIGSPVMLVGLFTLLMALLFFVGGEFSVFFFDESIPVGVQDVIEDTARAFVRDLWRTLAWQGGVLLMIGLGMWVLSFVVPVYDDWEPLVTETEDEGTGDERTQDEGTQDEEEASETEGM
jgi:hypothetical protein